MAKKLEKFFIKVKDIKNLLTWSYTYHRLLNDKSFKYESKFFDFLNVDDNVRHDVSDFIDDFMVETYMLYERVKNKIKNPYSLTELDAFLDDESPMFEMLEICGKSKEEIKKMKEESVSLAKLFVKDYERIIMNYLFDTANMTGIQRYLINDLMNEYASGENYEKCAELRDKLKTL